MITRFERLHRLLTGEPVLTEAERRAAAVIELKTVVADRYAHHDTRGYGRACMELEHLQRERLERGE